MKKLPRWAKWLLVAGGLLVIVGGVTYKLNYFAQADKRWGKMLLGFSPDGTIGKYGCFLTALTMALSKLKGVVYTPAQMNDIVKKAGGFSAGTANLNLPVAAAAVGLKAPNNERLRVNSNVNPVQVPTVTAMRGLIESTLARGGTPIVHVDKDYTPDFLGDHFIVIHKKEDNRYVAADPATGRDMFLNASDLQGQATWGNPKFTFKVVGVAPVYRA